MKHTIYYQSTHLSLQAPVDLALLADALAARGLFLYHAGPRHDDSWAATFTVTSRFREPEQDTTVLLTANKRLSASTLSRIAASSADLVTTINPIFDMEVVEAAVDILLKEKQIKRTIGKY